MTIRFASVRLSAVAVACAVLSACGGGGSDAGSSTAVVAAAGDITTENYTTAAAQSASAGTLINSFDAVAVDTLAGAGTEAPPTVAGVIAKLLPRLPAYMARQSGNVLAGASVDVTEACTDGGTVRVVALDFNNNEQFDSGESIEFTLNACREDGSAESGILKVTLNAQPTGDLATDVFGIDTTVSFTNFRSVGERITLSANGSVRSVGSRTAVNVGRDTLTISSLATSVTLNGVTTAETFSGFTADVQRLVGGDTITTLNGVLTSGSPARSLTLATATPFRRRAADAYSYLGKASVTGANGAKATLEVLNNVQVQITGDINGDGLADTGLVTTKNWSDLM